MRELTPLRWRDGSLDILDQRALPSAETWLRCQTPADVAEAIRDMAIRGAPAIGLAAAYGCALALDGGQRCTTEARVVFDQAARELAATRPTAVNLAWGVARGLEAADPVAEAVAETIEVQNAPAGIVVADGFVWLAVEAP